MLSLVMDAEPEAKKAKELLARFLEEQGLEIQQETKMIPLGVVIATELGAHLIGDLCQIAMDYLRTTGNKISLSC